MLKRMHTIWVCVQSLFAALCITKQQMPYAHRQPHHVETPLAWPTAEVTFSVNFPNCFYARLEQLKQVALNPLLLNPKVKTPTEVSVFDIRVCLA
ncbi:hypothetical protein XM79_c21390 [Vibrio vulnificus]|nr:hypothetical protein XM78_c21407 [Vibrio vulnificus]OQK61435.1 hypothetical protein XM79_c21390 [Vibrio vulnificus]